MDRLPIPAERIEKAILLIRGEKVMLDRDLAALYGVTTKSFNQAVARNQKRFPADFMFQLTWEEVEVLKPYLISGKGHALRSQIVTLKKGGHIKYRPHVFTEHGVAMLSSVLRSEQAIAVNIEIIRAFVRLRELLATHADLARKLNELEKKYDGQFKIVFQAIHELMKPPENPKGRIGFV